MRLIEFVYSINEMSLEKVDEIKDLGVITDGKMSFLPHIEAIISKSSRMLVFIKRYFQGIFVIRILIKLYTLH
jgi:hypothetical protein